jgi:hypothetical protein
MAVCSTNTNPLYNSYFRLVFGRGTSQMELMCQKVNLPGISIPDQPQPTRLGTTIPVPNMVANFEPLSVEFVVDSELTNWISLYSWIRNITNISNDDQNNITYQEWHYSANLFLYDPATNCEILRAKFNYIIPIKLGGIFFQSDSADVLVQKCQCSFKYSYFELLRGNRDIVPNVLYPGSTGI